MRGNQRKQERLSQGAAGDWSAAQTKNRLNSNAKVFVPVCHTHAAPASRRGMIPVHTAIKSALGSRLGSIGMKVKQSYTEVEVSVHAAPSDMCGTYPMRPLARACSYAMSMLLHTFQMMGPQIQSLQPTSDSRLVFKFRSSSADSLCPALRQYGQNLEHVAIELFIITIKMKPPIQNAIPASGVALPGEMVGYAINTLVPPPMDQGSDVVCALGPVMPTGLPIDPSYSPMTNSSQQVFVGCAEDSEWQASSTAAGSSERSGSSSPTDLPSPCGTPRLHCKQVRWADVDDNDGD